MPEPVKAVLYDPRLGDVPMAAEKWQMYDVPVAGSHYWHGTTGFRVDKTEVAGGETIVHLVRDPEWEEAMSSDLPDDRLVDGGRGSNTGQWHFQVVGPRGQVRGCTWAFGDELEPTIRQAVAGAIAHQ